MLRGTVLDIVFLLLLNLLIVKLFTRNSMQS